MILFFGMIGVGVVWCWIDLEYILLEENVFVFGLLVDYDFLEIFDLEIVVGWVFSWEFGSDYLDVFVINESVVILLGFEDLNVVIG